MNNDGMKLVEYDKYCKTCIHKKKKESEDPCWNCLCQPANVESHKPIHWEGEEK